MDNNLYPPTVSTILTHRFGMCFRFGFAVCNHRDNEYKPEGANGEKNPQAPADATTMFGFNVRNRLCKYILTAAFWTNYTNHLTSNLLKQYTSIIIIQIDNICNSF